MKRVSIGDDDDREINDGVFAKYISHGRTSNDRQLIMSTNAGSLDTYANLEKRNQSTHATRRSQSCSLKVFRNDGVDVKMELTCFHGY